ncbi:MAG: Mur ligase family protein [Acidobacteria bacterium]|nr:Mur ligase family protein [Acidobacteriota bacterium]
MDPLDALASLRRFGIKPGLDTIGHVMAAMGDPAAAYRSIIVAGTNGKGSVVAMTDASLRAAGYRVGRYTSPHLYALAQRFVVDGTAITECDLRREVAEVQDRVDGLVASGTLAQPATFFEMTTAIALSWFRREAVDVAVLEVGMGGRFDATNIVTPVAGAITPIGLEHQAYLGDTLEAIAGEKAGVIKPGMVVVTTETRPSLLTIFDEVCRAQGARLVCAAHGTEAIVRGAPSYPEIQLTTPRRTYPSFRLGLAGAHQVANAMGAVRLLEELASSGLPVPADAIVSGLSGVDWPGRLDLVQMGPDGAILFDAAHNPAAAATLAAFVRETYPDRLPFVVGAMPDKDIEGMIATLAPCATAFVCTATQTHGLVPSSELAARVRRVAGATPVQDEPDPWQAVVAGWRRHPTICVTGSIFLVGQLLAMTEAGGGTRFRAGR